MTSQSGYQGVPERIIAIDGPSGVGKGTLARWLSHRLGYEILDSGSIYRLAALHVLRSKVDIQNQDEVVSACAKMKIAFESNLDTIQVFLNSENVSMAIRNEKTGMTASIISAYPDLRALLLQKQRDFATDKGVVADGRDMGTVVFPEAKYKFFLDADAKVRAMRRFDELVAKGETPDFDNVYEQLAKRDHQDRTRKVAPLVAADDAVTIDTTSRSIEEVQLLVLRHINFSTGILL